MHYSQSYHLNKCFDKDCEECAFSMECIHFTMSESYEPEEEYRLYTALDDHTNEMIRSMISRLKSNISNVSNFLREIYVIFKIYWSLGYNLKDIYYLIKNNWPSKGPAILDQLMIWALPDRECLKYYFSDEENVEELEILEIKDGSDLLSLPSPTIIQKLAEIWNKNFTGEVRLSSNCDSDYDVDNKNDDNDYVNVFKLIKEIITLTSGREAYSRSQEVKNYVAQLKQAGQHKDAQLWQNRLTKAWEVRKRYFNLPPEERLKYLYA